MAAGGSSKSSKNVNDDAGSEEEVPLGLPKGSKAKGQKLPWIFDHLEGLRPTPGTQYRESTLGRTLKESIDELIAAGKITESLGESIMIHFDVHVAAHVGRCGVQATFVTSGLASFKDISQCYEFVLKGVEISSRGGRLPYNVCCNAVRVRAVPSVKLLKKNALKKSEKGKAYEDTEKARKRKEEMEEILCGNVHDEDDDD